MRAEPRRRSGPARPGEPVRGRATVAVPSLARRSLVPMALATLVLAPLSLTSCATTQPAQSAAEKGAAEATGAVDALGLPSTGPVAAPSDLAAPCLTLGRVTAAQSPADLYPEVAKCVRADRYDDAVGLFAVASTFGAFDMLRVGDKSLHRAIPALQTEHLWSLPEENRKALLGSFDSAFATGAPTHRIICARLAAVGAPTYEPSYMDPAGTGPPTGFDRAAAWRRALADHMRCR